MKKEYYKQATMESLASGGRTGRVNNEKTLDLHWRSLKAYVYFLDPVGPVFVRDVLTKDFTLLLSF